MSSTYPSSNTHIVDNMSSQEGVRAVDSAPAPHNEKEVSTPTTAETGVQDSTPEQDKGGPEADKPEDSNRKESSPGGGTVSPSQSSNSYPQVPPHQTPQQPGYYVAYNQSQVTPEPPSPAGPAGTTVYDLGSFMQQPSAGFHNSPFAAPHQYGVNPAPQQPQPPHSPSQNTSGSMGGILPASPLFPRVTGQATAGLLDQHISMQQRGTPLSPGPPYLPPQIVPSSMYPNMGVYAVPTHNGTSNNNSSPDDFQGWGDNR